MSGYCKYYKQKKQISYDSGATWQDVSEYRRGDLYESYSTDCGAIPIERWINSGTTCSGATGYDKYYIQAKQISYDDGSTWMNTSDYRLGSLIERNSSACGYVPPADEYEWFLIDGYMCDDCKSVGYTYRTAPGTSTSANTYTGECTNNGVLSGITGTNSNHISYVNIGTCFTSIGDSAFSRTRNDLEIVEMPSTITSIGNSAFTDCIALVDAAIPNSVRSIGNYAFANCSTLQSVFLPNGLTSLGEYAFANCLNFWTINIPSGLTSIPTGCFMGCEGLSDVEIPSNITSIGNNAFSGCTQMNRITVHSLIPPTLGSNAFADTNDCVIEIPCDAVDAYLGDNQWQQYSFRFTCMDMLRYLSRDVNEVNKRINCETSNDYMISSPITSGETGRLTATTDVKIGECVNGIGDGAFSGYTNLSTVNSVTDGYCNIPSGVTSIGNSAFYGCSSISHLDIPSSVTNIGSSAFTNCTRLTGNVTIPSGVTTINNYTFYNCNALSSVVIPNSITSIGKYAFYYCKYLNSMTIPSSVTNIGEYAFYYTNIKNVSIPSGITTINNYTFGACESLTSVTIPNSVTSIGEEAFYGCGFTSVTIPNSVLSIKKYAFLRCDKLRKVTIGANVVSIGDNAFAEGGTINELKIYNTIPPRLGERVFSLTNLNSIKVPSSAVNTYKTATGWRNYSSIITSI